MLLDLFGAILYLQRTALPLRALQADNLSAQTLCTVDSCNIETKLDIRVALRWSSKEVLCVLFLPPCWLQSIFPVLFRMNQPSCSTTDTSSRETLPVVMWRPLFRSSEQCLGLWMSALGHNIFRNLTTHFYISQQICCSSGAWFCILF